MATLKVVRPTEVQVYGCDNQDCDSICDGSSSGYDGASCRWIRFDDYTDIRSFGPRGVHAEAARLWFCGYECLSDWAVRKACETGEITCQAA